MKEEKVLIKYTDRNLAMRYGVKPIKVNKNVAESLKTKGWAIILNSPPKANPSLSAIEIEEIKSKYEEDYVLYMQEEKHITKVSWLFSNFIDLNIRKIGHRCGFKVAGINSVNFSPGKLILSDFIVVSSDLRGFSDIQLIELKSVIFQKSIPFIYRVESDNIFKNKDVRHFMMTAQCNFFVNDYLFDRAVDELGELFGDRWHIESDGYKFWKKIQDLKS